MKRIILLTVQLFFTSLFLQGQPIGLSVEKKVGTSEISFDIQIDDNWLTNNSIIPEFYYDADNKILSILNVRHAMQYSDCHQIEVIEINKSLEVANKTYPYFRSDCYRGTPKKLNTYLSNSLFNFLYDKLNTKQQLYDSTKNLDVVYNKKYFIESAEIPGLTITTIPKKNKILISLPDSTFSFLSKTISTSLSQKNKNLVLNSSSDESTLKELYRIQGCRNIDYIVRFNTDYLCRQLNHYSDDYRYLSCLSKETKLELLKKYFVENKIDYKDLTKQNFHESVKKYFKDISENEIYLTASSNNSKIETLEQYETFLKFSTDTKLNETYFTSFFEKYKTDLVNLSRLKKINSTLMQNKHLDELFYFDLVKDGITSLSFESLFPNPILTKNCKINKYYLGAKTNGLANGLGKAINNKMLYIGEFKNGLHNGNGKLYNSNGELIYEGSFKDNKYDGKGISYEYSDVPRQGRKYGDNNTVKNTFDGYWKNGLLNGNTIETYYCTSNLFDDDEYNYIMEGNWTDGKRSGRFIQKHITPNGEFAKNKFTAEGYYVDNKMDGTWFLSYNESLFGVLTEETQLYKMGVKQKKEKATITTANNTKGCEIKLVDWNESGKTAKFSVNTYTTARIEWKFERDYNHYFIDDNKGNMGYYSLEDNKVSYGTGLFKDDLGKASNLQSAIELILKKVYCY